MLQFTKMEGLGNDYIYMDGIHQNVPTDKKFIQKISDRHFGIGSDGLIIILESKIADFRMRMFNADGSEGKMCGNGIRCFAKFIYDHKLSEKTQFTVETLGGIKKVWLNIQNNEVISVKVDMGKPILDTKQIPVLFNKDTMVNEEIKIKDKTYQCTAISMGNPHIVSYVDDINFDLAAIGPDFEYNEMFPESINAEFVQVINDKHLKMRVWERGSQETMACGTGACAVFYASYLQNLCQNHCQVELLGGSLEIWLEEDTIYMNGPATTVFTGEIKEEQYA